MKMPPNSIGCKVGGLWCFNGIIMHILVGWQNATHEWVRDNYAIDFEWEM